MIIPNIWKNTKGSKPPTSGLYSIEDIEVVHLGTTKSEIHDYLARVAGMNIQTSQLCCVPGQDFNP